MAKFREVPFLSGLIPQVLRDLEMNWWYEVIQGKSGTALLYSHVKQDASATIAMDCVDAVECHHAREDFPLQFIRDQDMALPQTWECDPLPLQYGGVPEAACEMNYLIRENRFWDAGDRGQKTAK